MFQSKRPTSDHHQIITTRILKTWSHAEQIQLVIWDPL